MDNKNIFAENLTRFMKMQGKSRKEVCRDLGFNYYTFTDWINGRKYPRMDKVEVLANYFGILKSDLIEEKTTEQAERQKKSGIIADTALKMKSDSDFMSLVEMLLPLDSEKIGDVKQLLSMFLK